MIYLCLQENEIFQKAIMYFWICQYGISCVICANSVRNKNKYHLSFSCAQHGLHDVVVGFRRSLWLSGIITLLNFTLILRNSLETAWTVWKENYYAPGPGEDMLFYTDTRKLKFIHEDIKLRNLLLL